MISNKKEPGTSRGSNTSVAPSSSLINCRSRGTDLYPLSIEDMMVSSPICLLSKATKTKSWLWHRRLSHLNFGAINHLAKHGLVKFLASKDEALNFIIKFLKMIQVRLIAPVRNIHIDNGTEFVNQTLRDYYEKAEAVATTFYTQNRSNIRRHHRKTPYELLHDRKPNLSYLHVFGALFYLNNDSENLGKLQAKADIGIFIGYAPMKKAYRIYNRRTQKIFETIHVDFDELTAMASEQSNLEPVLHEMTPTTPISGFVPNPSPSAPFIPPSRHEWDLVFQLVFDEFFTALASVAFPVPVVEALAHVESTGSPFSTSVDQDAPSPIEPKTYKEALTYSCWIEAMHEELNEFELLEV
ncbi:retrovirus-related pol polyprotein from transposon TNT 1-94 [Tanacetum coccineum]